ncbi:MAG: TetR/AcrR family transcriptional regulator [Nevskia sp.]|nr:TetR/AcrR family transcriptional regulator [Nevskia sp.]
MPRKPAHQQFDTLKALQERAFDLFGRFGYDGVSIGDIAKSANLSKGALYWHYAGKEALFLDCLKRLHALFNEFVFAPMTAEPDARRAVLNLFRGVERLAEIPSIRNGIAGFWLLPATPETADLAASQREFELASKQVVETTLQRGVDQGHFDLHGDLEDFSRAVIALVEAVVILPLRYQSHEEVHQIVDVLARALFRAYAKAGLPPPI